MPRALVRLAGKADIAVCLTLAKREKVSPSGLADDLDDEDRLLLVAEYADGRVVGYARAMHFLRASDASANTAPTGYYLVGLVVDRASRRSSIGSDLTQARLAWICTRADEAWYFANARNLASISLHNRLGFREVTREFAFPGVGFEGGEGILFRVRLDGTTADVVAAAHRRVDR